jgi:hypothetical protein
MAEKGTRDAFRAECRKGGEQGQTLEIGISPETVVSPIQAVPQRTWVSF